MALPTSRSEYRDYIMRKLGFPVIDLNLDDDQIDDRIDDALQYWWDYHFDGTEKMYYRHVVTASNRQGAIYSVTVANGGIGYSNGSSLTFTRQGGSVGFNAEATISTNANGTITGVNITTPGTHYSIAPSISVAGGSGANLQPVLGGFVPLPENIVGAINIFPLGGLSVSTNDIFNIKYQIALNDLYTLTAQSMVPYYMAMQHISLLEELLVGKQPLRYNRHRNRIELDMDWAKVTDGMILVIEAYQIIDPADFPNVWKDRWLLKYGAALLKKQWAQNLIKFRQMSLPGNVLFNARELYDDAEREIEKLESEMINTYSLPVSDMVG